MENTFQPICIMIFDQTNKQVYYKYVGETYSGDTIVGNIVYDDGDYDYDRYDNDEDYAEGVDDAMAEIDW